MFEVGIQLVAVVGACMAVYAGIRADLAAMKEDIEHAQNMADRAHTRIDDLLKG